MERLGRVGLVTRESAAEDRRGAYAVLTDLGLQTLHTALREHVALVRARFLDRFSAEELAVMASYWRRVEAAAPIT